MGGGAAGTGRRQEKAGPRHPWRKFRPRDPLTGEGEAGCGFSSGCGGGPGSPLGCFAGRPWALELLPGATESQISPPGRCHSQEMAGPWKPSQGKPPLPASVGAPPPRQWGLGWGGRVPGGSRHHDPGGGRSGPRTPVPPPSRGDARFQDAGKRLRGGKAMPIRDSSLFPGEQKSPRPVPELGGEQVSAGTPAALPALVPPHPPTRAPPGPGREAPTSQAQ